MSNPYAFTGHIARAVLIVFVLFGGANLVFASTSLSPTNESVDQFPIAGAKIVNKLPLDSEMNLPKFGDFPSGYSDKLSVNRTYNDAWMLGFPTRIKAAFKEKSNFSQNSNITMWGCGTSCTMGVMVNKINGVAYSLPLGGEENPILSLYSQRGSDLLLGTWERDFLDENLSCVFEAFVWDGKDGFAPVDGYPLVKPGSCPSDISLPD